jgi:hypothetical protein
MKRFKLKVGVVEVGILESDGLYFWEFTNFGSTEERAKAIDELNKIYYFQNWGKNEN